MPTETSATTATTMSVRVLVTGATGNQGRGILRSLLSTKAPQKQPAYIISAMTRDPTSQAAQDLPHLYSNNLKLVQYDFNDLHSLARVYNSVDIAFHVQPQTGNVEKDQR
ncbi:hypothetical protein B0H63DRAFT_544874 [Podospora didyma]|uniref:NmrA-like domain-containing protein n=1 Tax=Podospora didyma TaxID=330526 RepID=A0AAE0TVD4_9PEZI|nr:hypothetical protein B0H63DRAFT_544874 [Podospora didyma]